MANVFDLWKVTPDEVSTAILENGSLRGMVFGFVAEIKLRELLQASLDVSSATKDDDHDRTKKGDVRVLYKGYEFKIESKSLQTTRNKKRADGSWVGVAQVDASDRRTVLLPDGTSLATTNLLVGEFDVLAVNCFSFENEWNWAFARNEDLPRSTFRNYTQEQRQYLLATTVQIAWPVQGIFTDNLFSLLDALVTERKSAVPTAPEPIILAEAEMNLPPDEVSPH